MCSQQLKQQANQPAERQAEWDAPIALPVLPAQDPAAQHVDDAQTQLELLLTKIDPGEDKQELTNLVESLGQKLYQLIESAERSLPDQRTSSKEALEIIKRLQKAAVGLGENPGKAEYQRFEKAAETIITQSQDRLLRLRLTEIDGVGEVSFKADGSISFRYKNNEFSLSRDEFNQLTSINLDKSAFPFSITSTRKDAPEGAVPVDMSARGAERDNFEYALGTILKNHQSAAEALRTELGIVQAKLEFVTQELFETTVEIKGKPTRLVITPRDILTVSNDEELKQRLATEADKHHNFAAAKDKDLRLLSGTDPQGKPIYVLENTDTFSRTYFDSNLKRTELYRYNATYGLLHFPGGSAFSSRTVFNQNGSSTEYALLKGRKQPLAEVQRDPQQRIVLRESFSEDGDLQSRRDYRINEYTEFLLSGKLALKLTLDKDDAKKVLDAVLFNPQGEELRSFAAEKAADPKLTVDAYISRLRDWSGGNAFLLARVDDLFGSYVDDSLETDRVHQIARVIDRNDFWQTPEQTIARNFRGDCDDLSFLKQRLRQTDDRHPVVLNIPGHALCCELWKDEAGRYHAMTQGTFGVDIDGKHYIPRPPERHEAELPSDSYAEYYPGYQSEGYESAAAALNSVFYKFRFGGPGLAQGRELALTDSSLVDVLLVPEEGKKALLSMPIEALIDRKLYNALVTADSARRAGKHQEAITQYSALIKKSPEQAIYHFELGQTLLLTGKYSDAEKSLAKAAELDPELQQVLAAQGSRFLLDDKPEQAWAKYAELINSSENGIGELLTHIQHFDDLNKAGEFSKRAVTLCHEQLSKITTADPHDIQAYNLRESIFSLYGEPNEIVSMWRDYLKVCRDEFADAIKAGSDTEETEKAQRVARSQLHRAVSVLLYRCTEHRTADRMEVRKLQSLLRGANDAETIKLLDEYFKK